MPFWTWAIPIEAKKKRRMKDRPGEETSKGKRKEERKKEWIVKLTEFHPVLHLRQTDTLPI